MRPASWPREESNLRTQLRRLPLCPLSYGAERPKGNPAPRSLRCAGSVAVAQSVELRVVVPVAAGSSPVRHPPKQAESAGRHRRRRPPVATRWLQLVTTCGPTGAVAVVCVVGRPDTETRASQLEA